VQLSRVPSGGNVPEVALIEFATSREVLFSCGSHLEFADRVRLQNADGSLDVEASVVAVQYHEGEIALAARFDSNVSNWIVTI
jgi:hypothetical protein